MKYQELTNKTIGELYELLYKLRKELVGLRMKHKTGQLQSPISLRFVRRDIARIVTRINAFKGSK
ncbi:MAG: 50S ribosomal protein L29 [Proteobacteria bacterium]|nr:50S ribosomal protein L29 [Pseudomonadota bacterium]